MDTDITSAIIIKALFPEISLSIPEGYNQEQFEKAAQDLRDDLGASDQPFAPLARVDIADSAKT